jgi:hypothetical protein
MPKHPKRPRDPNQLAKLVVDLLTGNATESPEQLPEHAQDDESPAQKTLKPKHQRNPGRSC